MDLEVRLCLGEGSGCKKFKQLPSSHQHTLQQKGRRPKRRAPSPIASLTFISMISEAPP
jgi:hypothetical protein